MKKIKYVTLFLSAVIFLWMLFVTAFPIKMSSLKDSYDICDLGNVNTWDLRPDKFLYIKSEINYRKEAEEKFVEIFYPQQGDRPFFTCKKIIPAYLIYKAQTLNAKIKLNKPGEINIGLITHGVGPSWRSQVKEKDVNEVVTLSWPLEREDSAKTLKLNWLPGDYKGTAIYFEKSDQSKDTIITIYELYIK